MEDQVIIEQLQQRSETAITAITDKYARYCHTIAFNILGNIEDAEEIVNDTYNRV